MTGNIGILSKRSGISRDRLKCCVAPLCSAVILAGCSVLPAANGVAHAAAEPQYLAPSERAQLMYEVMIAELAGRRGYLDIATEGYNSASKRTSDPRIAERATKLSVYSRNWSQAAEAGERWSGLDPKNPEVHQLLTQVHLRQSDPESAAEQMQKLIEVSDDSAEMTLHGLYVSLAREPDAKTALSAMALLAQRFPKEAAAHLALSRLSLGSGEREDALLAVDKALALQPDDSEALLVRAQVLMSQGKGSEGLDELATAVEKNPDDVDLHLGYARLLVDAGRYDQAETELESIFSKAPDDAQAIFTIGLLGLESKRNVAASSYFNRLLELGEYESEAHYYLARIADSQQNYPDAIGHYESVVSGDSFIDAQVRAAELYGLTGEVEKGRELLAELASNHGDRDLMPRIIRAEARMLRQADRGGEALEVLAEGLVQFPDNGDLLYTRALIAENEGDSELFESDLRKLIKAEPDNAHALNALGYYFADNNKNLEEADEMLQKAIKLLPLDPAIQDSVGWVKYRLGENEEALIFLRKAYEQIQDAEIAAHLGEVLWVMGEQERAREIWDKALAASPDDAKLKSVVERFVQ